MRVGAGEQLVQHVEVALALGRAAQPLLRTPAREKHNPTRLVTERN